MGKSVYSLVLSDDVVIAIDRMAAQKGCSRSALIDHILAEYAHLCTPKQRNTAINKQVEQRAHQKGLRTDYTPGGTLSLYSVLRYRYNPCVRYNIELSEHDETTGRLTVGMRTQNEQLATSLSLFFDTWAELENSFLENPPRTQTTQAANRFTRQLRLSSSQGAEDMGASISDYITVMDSCLKTFFEFENDPQAAQIQTESLYRKLIAKWDVAESL